MLAIDVGTRKVCVLEGKARKDKVVVTAFGEIEYETQLVSDGKIQDHATLGFYINEIIKTLKMRSREAVVTINSTAVVAREFTLPKVKQDKLEQLVQNEMMMVLGSESGYVTDYIVIDQTPEGMLKVQAFAAPVELVEDYRRLLEELRLKPHALDLHTNAISKLCTDSAFNKTKPGEDNVILADIGYTHICFYSFCKGVCQFFRTEASPLRDFMDEIGTLRHEDANSKTMAHLAFWSPAAKEDSALADAVDRFTTRLTDEIQRYTQYVLLNSVYKSVSNIYIIGGAACLKGLDAVLTQQLGIHTQVLESVTGLRLPMGCRLAKACNAAGALIRL